MEVKVSGEQLNLFRQVESTSRGEEDPFSDEVLERIKNDSFYGQSDLSLDFINQQITKAYETIGTPEAIQEFVFSALNRMNCHVDQNPDGTYKIVIQHPELLLPGLPAEIKKATFDPEIGLDNTELEVFDLGHPLVRRLMDLIKQEAFTPELESYGRTAAILTHEVDEMTALYTVLVRYVTDSIPAEFIEDLVTVALPIYSQDTLSTEKSCRLIYAKPAVGSLSSREIQEVLEDALGKDELQQRIEEKILLRKEEIIAERKAIRASLQRDADWIETGEKIVVGSWDLLATRILWPA